MGRFRLVPIPRSRGKKHKLINCYGRWVFITGLISFTRHSQTTYCYPHNRNCAISLAITVIYDIYHNVCNDGVTRTCYGMTIFSWMAHTGSRLVNNCCLTLPDELLWLSWAGCRTPRSKNDKTTQIPTWTHGVSPVSNLRQVRKPTANNLTRVYVKFPNYIFT